MIKVNKVGTCSAAWEYAAYDAETDRLLGYFDIDRVKEKKSRLLWLGGSEITVSPRVPGEELPPVAEAPAKNIVSIVDYDGRHVLGPDEYEIVSVDESAWD